MFTGVNLGCMVEMEPTRANFKIWVQHRILELAGVNLGRGSNSGLNKTNFQVDFVQGAHETRTETGFYDVAKEILE